ncbi:hypothetical protein [Caldilinea sp.]|mgnify:CR=1 FL=1|jgi:hypothetical protein|uniref:hypothetical protein n=1 Tax=Caldilinea sp. TaxID=2293560 RepID=UPI0021DDD9C2|nr:hypothetical protein [Caldilinea sp.]GIV70364.1 MAG: hypothetical protein KatS3mg048_3226 [Caldilinea sp.]
MNAKTGAGDRRVYSIVVRGQVDEEFVAAYCPAATKMTWDGDATRLSNIHTDQAGIVGLVRHLHSLGYVVLSLES